MDALETAHADADTVAIAIGGWALVLHCADAGFLTQDRRYYCKFLCAAAQARAHIEIEIVAPRTAVEREIEVRRRGGEWAIRRGDFEASWNPATGSGRLTQSANPYSLDSFLRVLHSLHLAAAGGFLLHAASMIYQGRALIFSGLSGAGKSTLAGLAPASAILLSDEISYVRSLDRIFGAYGTPFSGELRRSGENRAAPVSRVYFLGHAEEHRITPLAPVRAVEKLMRNTLFFIDEPTLTRELFNSILDFVARVPAFELAFAPDASVWGLL